MARIGAIAITATTLLLFGCMTSNEAYYGSGPIQLSGSCQAHFERYLREIDPGYFAVTPDGSRCGYSYCDSMQCRGNEIMLALSSCRRSGRTCQIYAHGRQIVWDTAQSPPGALRK